MSEFNAETVQKIAAMAKPEVLTSTLRGGQPSVLVPNEYKVCVLPTDQSLAERPQRIKAHVKVYEEESFNRYFNDFKDLDSRVFADEKSGQIVGILDYHEDSHHGELESAAPRWCCHRVELTLRRSEEWTLWTSQNTKRMSQEDFARFIEDNAPDVLAPEPATMLEIARSMTAKLEINVDSAVRTNKGATFRYNEVVKAGGLGAAGEFSIPDEFTIQIPVYVGGDPLNIRARLRYQIGGGKLAMWYDLWRFQQAERAAFAGVLSGIAAGTEVAIIAGSPA